MTVAEDDTVFSHSFAAHAKTLLAGLPADWDIVLWGYNLWTFLWVEVPRGVGAVEIRWNSRLMRDNLGRFAGAPDVPALLKLLHAFGTQCYSVSPHGAAALLKNCLPLQSGFTRFRHFPITSRNEGIDGIMNGFYPSLEAYACFPPLVVPDDSQASTIR